MQLVITVWRSPAGGDRDQAPDRRDACTASGVRGAAHLVQRLISPPHHVPQHLLYFAPLPHGQGSFRPGFGSAFTGWAAFSNFSRSVRSSGLSGSTPTTAFKPCFSHRSRTSRALSSDLTRRTAGRAAVPSFAKSVLLFSSLWAHALCLRVPAAGSAPRRGSLDYSIHFRLPITII